MTFIYPAKTRRVTCDFYCYSGHNAVDFGCVNEPVWAMEKGTVKMALNPSSPSQYGRTGKYIEVLHEGGIVSRYLHLSRVDVGVGQAVEQGQQIGITGATGFTADGKPYDPHLHLALWYPTREAALAVWHDPRPTLGMWAVDPVTVIENSQEGESMATTRENITQLMKEGEAVAAEIVAGIRAPFVRADGTSKVYKIVDGRKVWLETEMIAAAEGMAPDQSNVTVIFGVQLNCWPDG